ncbi:MAG: efflux RND transporter periplasmic adaptor subunit [Bacteroidaceae bacterium]|nr:efflux RND transporter periplasmic adaptor subunit [Bacteroidaceae bacterium]
MKNTFFLAILVIALCGCGHNHSVEAEHAHTHLHNFTAYSNSNEFFMQHEGLEAGAKSCITLFVTELESFDPAKAVEAKATLMVGGSEQKATATRSKEGIFNFDIVPAKSGSGNLFFEVGDDKVRFPVTVNAAGHSHDHSADAHAGHSYDEAGHDCGSHDHSADAHAVHSHDEAGHDCGSHDHSADAHAGHSHDEAGHDCSSHDHSHDAPVVFSDFTHVAFGSETEGAADDVAFTKEQSWKIDFATAVVEKQNFGGAVKVVAKVVATPQDFTTIVATTSGKVQFVGNVVEGKDVVAGEPLFYLEGGDVTDNDAAVKYAEAESNYLLAKSDYERKKLLFNDMVVSERELEAAEALYKQTEARFQSLKRSFGNGKVTLKAVKNGYIASLLVSNGDYVEPGTPIATVQCNGNYNIVAELPVRFAPQLRNIADVNIVLPTGEAFSMNAAGGSVVAVGSAANGCNMLPLTISAGAIDGVVPGSIVTLYITSVSDTKAVVVPRTALVEEMGNFFVFVQNNPISFEKRTVEVGATDGIMVQVLDGVAAGERVVTKGAVSLKLSQGAAALDPHAGHVH